MPTAARRAERAAHAGDRKSKFAQIAVKAQR
jgi:hypothetical protein